MSEPTEPGWYWYKFGNKPWSITRVEKYRGRLYARGEDGPIYWLDERENGFVEKVTAWVGPIQPPEEQK